MLYFFIIITFGIFSTPAGKRYQQLLQQVEKLQEENFKIDAGRNQYINYHFNMIKKEPKYLI